MGRDEHVFFWATVVSLNPLTVRRDGETAPMGVSPSSLVNMGNATLSVDLEPGDRVWCQLQHRRALVLGRSGGLPRNGRFYSAMPGEPGMMFAANRGNSQGPGLWFSQAGDASGSDAALWITKKSSSEFADADILNIRGPAGGSGIMFRNGPFEFDGTIDGRIDTSGSSYFRGDLRNTGFHETSASINVRMNSGGLFYRVTSTRKTKVNIETVDADIVPRILDLEPRIWFDRNEVEGRLGANEGLVEDTDEGPRADVDQLAGECTGGVPRRVPGLVAEEVRDAGLDDYVTYDDDGGGDEELSSVAYDRLWTLLIPLVRDQRDRIAELETTVESLVERVDALERDEGAA